MCLNDTRLCVLSPMTSFVFELCDKDEYIFSLMLAALTLRQYIHPVHNRTPLESTFVNLAPFDLHCA